MQRYDEAGARVPRSVALVVTVVAALVAVFGLSGPAGADAVEVTGTFEGPGTFDPDGFIFHTQHDISGTWSGLGQVTAHLAYDADLSVSPTQPPLSNGTFTITTPSGTLTGDLDGALGPAPDPDGSWPAQYQLTVTGGTGAYEGASGQLGLDAHFDGTPAPIFHVVGAVSGQIEVGPTGTTSSTTSSSTTSSTTQPPTTTTMPSGPTAPPTGPFGPPPPATPIEEPPPTTG